MITLITKNTHYPCNITSSAYLRAPEFDKDIIRQLCGSLYCISDIVIAYDLEIPVQYYTQEIQPYYTDNWTGKSIPDINIYAHRTGKWEKEGIVSTKDITNFFDFIHINDESIFWERFQKNLQLIDTFFGPSLDTIFIDYDFFPANTSDNFQQIVTQLSSLGKNKNFVIIIDFRFLEYLQTKYDIPEFSCDNEINIFINTSIPCTDSTLNFEVLNVTDEKNKFANYKKNNYTPSENAKEIFDGIIRKYKIETNCIKDKKAFSKYKIKAIKQIEINQDIVILRKKTVENFIQKFLPDLSNNTNDLTLFLEIFQRVNLMNPNTDKRTFLNFFNQKDFKSLIEEMSKYGLEKNNNEETPTLSHDSTKKIIYLKEDILKPQTNDNFRNNLYFKQILLELALIYQFTEKNLNDLLHFYGYSLTSYSIRDLIIKYILQNRSNNPTSIEVDVNIYKYLLREEQIQYY